MLINTKIMNYQYLSIYVVLCKLISVKSDFFAGLYNTIKNNKILKNIVKNQVVIRTKN